MATLPAASDFTGSSRTEGQVKTFVADLRSFLSDALGTDSTALTPSGSLTATGTVRSNTQIHGETSALSEPAAYFDATNASYDEIGIVTVRATRNTTNNSYFGYSLYNTTAAAYRFAVADSGNVTNTNNSYGAISDPDLKKDIKLAGSQWDDVKLLAQRVVKYKLKADPSGVTQIGFVSRDCDDAPGVQSVCPGLVFETPERVQREVVDANGKKQILSVKTGKIIQGVHYSVAAMKAFKALGEALERIEQLEARLAALESR